MSLFGGAALIVRQIVSAFKNLKKNDGCDRRDSIIVKIFKNFYRFSSLKR